MLLFSVFPMKLGENVQDSLRSSLPCLSFIVPLSFPHRSKQANKWLNESGNDRTILIDASTAFRVDPTFTYGFPELSSEQKVNAKLRINSF